MDPYRLRRLFNSFGHRMLDQAWRGDLLIERGYLDVEELREAVRDGYLVSEYGDGAGFIPLAVYLCASANFVADCFYTLTAKGWWVGVAIGASFEKPERVIVTYEPEGDRWPHIDY